jgi:hypothetical protein
MEVLQHECHGSYLPEELDRLDGGLADQALCASTPRLPRRELETLAPGIAPLPFATAPLAAEEPGNEAEALSATKLVRAGSSHAEASGPDDVDERVGKSALAAACRPLDDEELRPAEVQALGHRRQLAQLGVAADQVSGPAPCRDATATGSERAWTSSGVAGPPGQPGRRPPGTGPRRQRSRQRLA